MLIYPVFIPFQGCPFRCIYCQQETITHHNTTDQVFNPDLLSQFIVKHQNDNKEVAFFGGTFTALTTSKQRAYFNQITPFTDLKTSFRVSTRPDFIDQEIIDFLKQHHVTTIELGIQSFHDQVLQDSKRGYTSKQAINACKIIKYNNLNLCIQLMPGLPGDDEESFNYSLDTALRISPEFMRIYPTLTLKGTELEEMYRHHQYSPWDLNTTIFILLKAVKKVQNSQTKIIKLGLHSDLNVSKTDVICGPWHENLGEIIQGILFLEKVISENGYQKVLYISKYEASMVLGNHQFVIDFFRNQLKLALPEKILIDKDLEKCSNYMSEKIKEER